MKRQRKNGGEEQERTTPVFTPKKMDHPSGPRLFQEGLGGVLFLTLVIFSVNLNVNLHNCSSYPSGTVLCTQKIKYPCYSAFSVVGSCERPSVYNSQEKM